MVQSRRAHDLRVLPSDFQSCGGPSPTACGDSATPGRASTKSKAQIERGLRWRATPWDVAAAVGVSFSMVSDDKALAAVTCGPQGMLAGLEDGRCTSIRARSAGQPPAR
jgi:hypothetical protein